MKIAVTADLHLNSKYLDRALALQNILAQLDTEGIQHLIIAGDLFDKDGDDSAYSSFLDPCRSYPDIQIHLIPGNHDSEQSLADLHLDSLHKYHTPEAVEFEGLQVLFVPYQKSLSMGDVINAAINFPEGQAWVLVGHGDFIDGLREPNPREKGIYMPLKKSDILESNLKKVFLGHIHSPTDLKKPLGGKVIYPGSPQGLDVSETGHRRFLVLDTNRIEVSERKVQSNSIFLDETFFVFPSDQEMKQLTEQLEQQLMLADWENEKERIYVRLQVVGFSRQKDELIESFTLKVKSLGIKLYESSHASHSPNPNFDGLLNANDPQRNLVARKVIEKIDLLDAKIEDSLPLEIEDKSRWRFDQGEPSKEQVKMAALKTIYQIGG